MPASSQNRRSTRQQFPLTPAVTTVRRGGHRPVVTSAPEAVQPAAVKPVAGLDLLSSARGVRLSRNR